MGDASMEKLAWELLIEDLLEFVLSCKEVVTFFHNHHVLRAKLKAACELAKLRDLVRMEQTLWGTTQKQL